MIVSNALMKNKQLSANEKLLLAYIMRGNYRYKYISNEKLQNVIFSSSATTCRAMKNLETMGYIRYIRPAEKRYKIIIVCQKAFNAFALIKDKKDICETPPLADRTILLYGQNEAQKDLIIKK